MKFIRFVATTLVCLTVRTGSGYTYDRGNPFRLVSFGGNAMAHDGNGNLTRVGPEGTPLAAYTFTPNNLLDVSTAGGVVNRFTCDADDWRVKKAVDGGATMYYVRGSNGQLLSEVTVNGSTTTSRDHIYAGARLISVATSVSTQ